IAIRLIVLNIAGRPWRNRGVHFSAVPCGGQKPMKAFAPNGGRPSLLALLLGLWTLDSGLWTACAAAPVHGWLSWRGPQQNGCSLEKNLPDKLNAKEALWVADFPGQSTPVIANGKVYIMGYLGEGPDRQQGIACFDAEAG